MKDNDAYLDAAAALLGLPIPRQYREEILAAFTVLREQAARFTEFELPGHTEAAPRFTP